MLDEAALRRLLWGLNIFVLALVTIAIVWVSWLSLATYTQAVQTSAHVTVLHSMLVQPDAALPGAAREDEVEALRGKVRDLEQIIYGEAE